MQTAVAKRQGVSWLRAAGLLAGLVALEAGILRLVGPAPDQVRALGRVGDPAVEPVSGFLDLLALVTELVAAYLAVVVVLRMLARLPGALGRLASGGLRRLTLPVVRRVLDGLVGGALLAQVTLSPAQVVAGTGPPGFAPRVVAATPAPGALGSGSGSGVGSGSGSAGGGAVGGPGALPTASTVPGPPWILGTAGSEAWPGPAPGPAPAPAPATVVGPAGPPPVPPSTVVPGAPVPPPVVPPVGPGDGRVVPDAAPGGASAGAPSPSGTGRPDAGQHGVHTVRPGDTLWGIAAAHLPAGSRSPAQVDRYWRQIYAANRAAIGSDPDMIHPGTRLKVPAFRPVPADHR
jgi:hypothetical protein